jgi:hypothetical protein
MKVRLLIFDEDFIKENPNIIESLTSLKEPIPMKIHERIIDYYPNFNKERSLLFGDDKIFMDIVREERFNARKLEPIESREYHNTLALQFINNHPEFAPILKEVRYIDV